MGRKRKGSVIGDIGKMWVNTIASPLEALTGQNFVDFKYTSDFGKGASKVVEPLTKGISSAMMAMGTTALNALAPGAGTALSGMGQGLGQGMKPTSNSIQQPPMQMSNKTRPTSGIKSVPYGVQEGMPKTGYRNGGPMDSADLNRFIKSSIAANRGKNFVDRIVDPYAPSTNVMGVPATHYMSSAEVDGRNIVYPNVVQRGSGNQLQQLSPEEALDYALKTGEFMEFRTPEEANNFATNYKQEMTRKFKHGGMLKAYNAPTHENGGQMIDQNANPTNNPNKAVGEIEKKETSWNGYVFSDTLGEGKKTFAQMSKEIVNRYKGKRDNLSKKTMERELMLLIQKNEAARLEKEQMEMQQMQNQFTEEELATLQNPQSPSKEQLDMLFAQQQQQQQGQPSQEQMMQMMQQQQMQQQGQPSEEEMMMMQQMQQQGAPQDMGQYRWGGNMDIPMYQYQNGGMLEVPEAPLDEYKKGGWIQKVTKSIKRRGTEGVCTGDKFGGPSCPPGSKRYNLAKTFRAMAKKEDGGYIDSLPDISLAKYPDGGEIQEPNPGFFERMANGMQIGLDLAQLTPLAPEAYLVSLPFTTYDVAKNLYRGDYAQAGADALGYIPEVRGVRAAQGLVKQGVKEYKTVNRAVNVANLANDAQKTYRDNTEENNKNRTATQKVKNMKNAAKPEETYYGGELPEVTVRPKKEYKNGGTIQKYPNGGMMAPEWMESAQWPYRIKEKDKRDDVIKNFYYGIIDDLQNPQAARQTLKDINQYYGTDRLEGLGKEIGPYFGFDYNDINDKDLDRWTNEYMEQRGFNKKPTSGEYKNGGMIKRADGSYSKRGLWDNIRDNTGSGKKPTKEMLEQERKIKAQEYRDGGYVVTRSNERKGKTHKVTGPDGSVKFFGDPDLKNNPSEKAKNAFYARHKKNLEGNPYFRAYARATWRDGGMIPEYPDGGGLDEIATAFVPNVEFKMNKPIPQSFGYTDKNVIAFVNKAKKIRNEYRDYPGGDFMYAYGEKQNPLDESVGDFEELKRLYSKLPENAKKTYKDTYNTIEKYLYGTEPNDVIATKISNTGIDKFRPIVPKKPIAQKQNQNNPIEMPPSYPIDRTTAPYTPMAGQSRPRKSLWFKTTPLEDEIAYDAYDDTYVVPQYPPPAIPDFNLNDVANVGNLFNVPTTNAPNYTPLNQQFPAETSTPNPFIQQQEIQSTPLQNTPNYISTERMLTPYEQADAFQQQMIAAQQAAQGDTNIPYAPGYKPETPGPKEDPFKLRPLEYATIGLKGLALGKSIYDALQPADKEQLRLNREAGLVNNMMAGRNVNMAAALNEALYNRNAALASNQARSANVQRALDMQTYSNTERNAIRSKLEEQAMNNQLRMQEAQTRAELGAAEAAERVRRQNVQSMNEAARRAFGQKAFQDLSTIGTELNKAQVYKDMYKNQRDIAERQYNEYLSFLQQSGGRFTVANLPYTDYLQGKIPQIVVNTEYQQPTPQEPKKPG